mmetsp:Transcript_70225/g.203626  ORF Transcript_70225/g.203626 Transcript_70225/m.203626 type:complete len:200 (+) Transcript_70225:281-880(+)
MRAQLLQPLRHFPHDALHPVEAVLDVVARDSLLLGPRGVDGGCPTMAADGLDVCRVQVGGLQDLDGARHARVALAKAHRRVEVQRADESVPASPRRQSQRLDDLSAPRQACEADHALEGQAVGLHELRDQQVEQEDGRGEVERHQQQPQSGDGVVQLVAILVVHHPNEELPQRDYAHPQGVPAVRLDLKRGGRCGEGYG